MPPFPGHGACWRPPCPTWPYWTGICPTGKTQTFAGNCDSTGPSLFLAEAPFFPVALFALGIVLFVALAYALCARRILSSDLTDHLKDDSLL